ncbi:MAG: nidogen-like domain-containing protein [Pseudomonadota bacterium]
MVALVSGLGGPSGFGENFLERNDDGSTNAIDISSVFELGIDFFGTRYGALFVNNNGSVTFNAPRATFTPNAITSNSGNPEISPFFGDVDTRAVPSGGFGPGVGVGGNGMLGDNGNSTGSNLVWYALDTEGDRLVVTWDDVGYFNTRDDLTNAFQLILTDRGGGDFDIEFRYEDINWTTGEASGGVDGLGGVVARAGWTAGTGDPAEFFELPQSGIQAQILALEDTPGNTGQDGRWFFSVRGGNVLVSDLPTGPENPIVGAVFGDPHLVTFDGIGYDFQATGEYLLATETAGSIEVQARFEEVADDLSTTTAVATRLGDFNIVIDARADQPLQIGASFLDLEDFTGVRVGEGIVGRQGNVFTVVYPGADNEANDGDERLVVTITDDRVDVRMELAADRTGGFEGLLGNADGDPANDIALANGEALDRPLTFEGLYGGYRADWRVTEAGPEQPPFVLPVAPPPPGEGGDGTGTGTGGGVGPGQPIFTGGAGADGLEMTRTEPIVSLFSYEDGAGPDTLFDAAQPSAFVTLDDLDPDARATAEAAATAEGLVPGTYNFTSAVIDFAVTGDRSYLESALLAPVVADSMVLTASSGALDTPGAEAVALLYEAGLDRDGNIDLAGLNFWIDRREAGASQEEIAQAFLESFEFTQSFGAIDSLSDEELVDALFENVLDRAPDEGGRAFWIATLAAPEVDRADLLIAFSESGENIASAPWLGTLVESEPGFWEFA